MRRRIYGRDLYYGGADYITINQNLLDPATMISGDVRGPEIQWIRDNSHRVLGKMTSSGVMAVCRLNDNDSNYFHDGNVADLTASQGDVFMRLPRFFYHAEEVETDVWKIGFSRARVASDWKEWDGKDLVGVYKASSDGNKIYSKSGTKPVTQTSKDVFDAMVIRGGSGYSVITYESHRMMAFLFYAYYGNVDSQIVCGLGKSDIGDYTGGSDVLGMTDTIYGNNDNLFVNFWGLERWWGDLSEWVDGVSVNNGVWTVEGHDGNREVQSVSAFGHISKISIGPDLDLIPIEIGNNLYGDYCYASYGLGLSLARSYYGNGEYGGISYTNVVNGSSSYFPDCGSRLAYRGDIEEIEASSEYISL